jgi:hypothetical protein
VVKKVGYPNLEKRYSSKVKSAIWYEVHKREPYETMRIPEEASRFKKEFLERLAFEPSSEGPYS